jgi:two-component system nitrogen regulation response regulator GlnG
MLARHQNNQLRAARALGINRNTLRKRLDTLGIEMGADRSDGAD